MKILFLVKVIYSRCRTKEKYLNTEIYLCKSTLLSFDESKK